MAGLFRITIHDPKDKNGPPLGVVRLQYNDGTPADDVPVRTLPLVIERVLAQGKFESARSLANAWFVATAHLHGHLHVVLT